MTKKKMKKKMTILLITVKNHQSDIRTNELCQKEMLGGHGVTHGVYKGGQKCKNFEVGTSHVFRLQGGGGNG